MQDIANAPIVSKSRPAKGERRLQILQTLAEMLEQPTGDKITTAALARQLDLSEAALYRHFASKAQMFEALLEFIEQSCLGLVQQIRQSELTAPQQAQQIVLVLLQFAEKNPGMARVMLGDALVLEHERLNQRMDSFFDKIELHLKDILYPHASAQGSLTPTVQAQVQAGALTALAIGQIQRFVRSGFRRKPSERLGPALALLLP